MRLAQILVACFAVAIASSGSASADDHRWYSGPRGRHRVIHLGITLGAGAGYLVSETVLKSDLAPSACRWCTPTSYDVSIRNAVRWSDPTQALPLSDVAAFVAAPLTAIGLTMLASYGYEGDHLPRLLDDTIPVMEAGVLSGVLNQIVKFSVGEQRPFVHFGSPTRAHQVDDDVSFYSGHTTFAFALATSAGVVAHRRHCRLEPVVWATGYAIGAAAGYLRMAGDQHYFTDVVVGALVGTGIGVAVPLGLHSRALADHDVAIVPNGYGATVVGAF